MMLCLVTSPGPKQLVLIRTTRVCHYFQLEWNLKYQYCSGTSSKVPRVNRLFPIPTVLTVRRGGSSERLSNYWGYPAERDCTILLSPLVSGPPQVSSLLCVSRHNGLSHHCPKATAPNASWTGTSEQSARVNISLLETESSQEAHPQMEFPFESSIIAFLPSKIFGRWQSLNLHMIPPDTNAIYTKPD